MSPGQWQSSASLPRARPLLVDGGGTPPSEARNEGQGGKGKRKRSGRAQCFRHQKNEKPLVYVNDDALPPTLPPHTHLPRVLLVVKLEPVFGHVEGGGEGSGQLAPEPAADLAVGHLLPKVGTQGCGCRRGLEESPAICRSKQST